MSALRLRNDVQLKLPGGPTLLLHHARTPEEQATGLRGRRAYPHELRGILFPLGSGSRGSQVTFTMRDVPFDVLLVGLRSQQTAALVRVSGVKLMPGHSAGAALRVQDSEAHYALELAPGWREYFERARDSEALLGLAGLPDPFGSES